MENGTIFNKILIKCNLMDKNGQQLDSWIKSWYSNKLEKGTVVWATTYFMFHVKLKYKFVY